MNLQPIPPDTIDRISDLVHKLAGPMVEEFGLLLGDTVRAYRAKNLKRTLEKTQKILDASEITPGSVPPRILIPIIEASSLEDSESLQDLWAGLLATASAENDGFSPSFVETLKQLTPNEAQQLENVSMMSARAAGKPAVHEYMKLVIERPNSSPYVSPGVYKSVFAFDTFERLGLLQRDYEVAGRLDRYNDEISNNVDYWYSFTDYAARFLAACHGPVPQAPAEPSPETL